MSALPSSLLDTKHSEQTNAAEGLRKRGRASEKKTVAALKSHSEAEKRRRHRINAHLATLRGLVPRTDKMDKATLLAAVVRNVRNLKTMSTQASEGFLVPTDIDEVTVETLCDETEFGHPSYRVAISCDHRPQLLSDLKQVLETLNLKVLKAKFSSLGGRLKIEFVFTSGKKLGCSEEQEVLASSVHHALIHLVQGLCFNHIVSPVPPNKRPMLCFCRYSSSCPPK